MVSCADGGMVVEFVEDLLRMLLKQIRLVPVWISHTASVQYEAKKYAGQLDLSVLHKSR